MNPSGYAQSFLAGCAPGVPWGLAPEFEFGGGPMCDDINTDETHTRQNTKFYAYRVLRPLPAVFAAIFTMLFARKLYRYFEFGDFVKSKTM